MLVFDRVGKTWPGGARALDDVAFAVPRGGFVVLLGPSGAGKSTLLRMVNGLVELSAGKVIVEGIVVERRTLPEIRRRVAMIHQQFNLVDRLSVVANILSGAVASVPAWRAFLRWYPPELRRPAWDLCQAVGLSERELFRRAAFLSGGQQQRVGIARALILEPLLLLADEPVASLDPVIARDVLALLRDLACGRGATVALFSASTRLGARLCRPHRRPRLWASGLRRSVRGAEHGCSRAHLRRRQGPAKRCGVRRRMISTKAEPQSVACFIDRAPYGWRTVLAAIVLIALGIWSGARTELDRAAGEIGRFVAASVGFAEESQIASGLGGTLAKMWPPQISEREELARLELKDTERRPFLSRIELEEQIDRRLDPERLVFVEHVEKREVLVKPVGYLLIVLGKLAETIEMAFWSTFFAVLLSVPLAVAGAANCAPSRALYDAARSCVSLLRAVPELISALFLVLAFGFGPAAGVLALALHSAGFLGEFFAEDIENANRKPQEAM